MHTVFRALQTSIQHILDKDAREARPSSGLLQLPRTGCVAGERHSHFEEAV